MLGCVVGGFITLGELGDMLYLLFNGLFRGSSQAILVDVLRWRSWIGFWGVRVLARSKDPRLLYIFVLTTITQYSDYALHRMHTTIA